MDNKHLIEISKSPADLVFAYDKLFSNQALQFLAELTSTFDAEVNQLYYERSLRKYNFKKRNELPTFTRSEFRRDKVWKVRSVPKKLENRHLDLGDVSPANAQHFINSLKSNVQGVQVDFDDGHCPTWRNQIIGLHNVYKVIHGEISELKSVENLPTLMLRPRAWNMIEHNIMVGGKEVPGPLVDFALLMFHNGQLLSALNVGPCFYLSKLESSFEAELWNSIFVWSQNKLHIPYGTIKACVLIENILSAFSMDEILYELKDHSLGLNCGIWDYAASVIAKFGDRKDFILPDRNKYVNMQKHFLQKYMELVVQVCHFRGTFATGGMSAQIVLNENAEDTIQQVIRSKLLEIQIGIDGFLVYDTKLVDSMNKLWNSQCEKNSNQINYKFPQGIVTESDLLQMPVGGVTLVGLQHNIEVSILFIYNWLNGNGHFVHTGAIEDSATAEISRSQIWQWIRHAAKIEDNGVTVTKNLIYNLKEGFIGQQNLLVNDDLVISGEIFLEIVTAREFPDFISTYLSDSHVFRKRHEHNYLNKIKHKL